MVDKKPVKDLLAEGESKRIRQRIEFGIQALIRGNEQILLNGEFVEQLPHVLYARQKAEESEENRKIFARLGEIAVGDDHRFRERAVVVLSLFLDLSFKSGDSRVVQTVVHILSDWLRVQTEYGASYTVVCTQLSRWGKVKLKQGRFEDIDYLLHAMHDIESGKIKKPDVIVSHIRRMQEEFATDDVLDNLLKVSLKDNGKGREMARELLASMGPGVTDSIIDKLLISESKAQRAELLKLIPSDGKSISNLLAKRLEHHFPKYFIQDIIKMMSMVDDSSLFPDIQTFLSHEDVRVQRQAIRYIEKEGKGRKVHHLIEALFLVSDELKLQLIMQLATIGSDEVIESFLDLLALRKSFSETYQDELLVKLCIALEVSVQRRAVNLLEQVIDERKSLVGTADKVITAAVSALNKIEPRIRHGQTTAVPEEEEADDGKIRFSLNDQEEFEERVASLLREGQNGVVGEMLYDQALSAINDQEYAAAEHLRDRMLQVTPGEQARAMELTGMIRSGSGKKRISHLTLDIWSELRAIVSEEEFSALYGLMRLRQFDDDEVIVRHGNIDPSLYFIKEGFASLTCLCGDYESFLKRLQKGDVIGVASFFDASAWSVSLVAQKNVDLYYLEFAKFTRLQERYPDLEQKLYEYCIKKDKVPELLAMSGDDRRQLPRYPVQTIIRNSLLDRFGMKANKVFRAEMVEMSTGGLSFLTRIKAREHARLLLGKMIISQIEIGDNNSLKCKGTILGVKKKEEMDLYYSIHVRFDNLLSQSAVMDVVNFHKGR